MKKSINKILILLLSLTLAIGAVGCRAVTAYEIAVENGFKGTEQEWLESLKGEDGRDGDSGKDGQNLSFTIEEIYASAVKAGYKGDFLSFIKEYLSENTTEYNTEHAINKALFSVVDVICSFTEQGGKTTRSSGSGVIYNLDKEQGSALVITNYHVVYNKSSINPSRISSNIKLYLYGSEVEASALPATYVGGSMTYDIALVKVENSEILKNSNATEVKIANSNNVKVGSTAIAIGNPDASGISATAGIISVDSEYITMLGADERTTITFRCLRVDAAVNPGNSGGGLFNAKGELIGIVNAKTVDDEIENMGYAIPSTLAVNVAENILWNVTGGNTGVSKGLMGVEVSASESKAVYNEELQMIEIIETVKVNKVTVGSLVDGVLQTGDILESIEHNGVKTYCTRMFIVVDYMLSVRPNEKMTVNYIRNGVKMSHTFTVTSEYFSAIV